MKSFSFFVLSFMAVQTASCFQKQPYLTVLSVENETMTYKNTGTVPVGAVVVRKSTGEYQWADYSQPGGIQPGAVEKYSNMGAGANMSNTEITEVILQTGQVYGIRAREFDDLLDIAQEIFDYRSGQADALAEWKKIVDDLPQDHGAAIKAFLDTSMKLGPQPGVSRPPLPLGVPKDWYGDGRRLIEYEIRFISGRMAEEQRSHDAAFVHNLLREQVLQMVEGTSHSVVKEQK